MGLLEGKVAVITGGSRGLGLALAQAYTREGAAVVLGARSEDAVQEAVRALQEQGRRASGLATDVGELNQVKALAEHALEQFGRIDIWVNNAGAAGVYGPTAAMPPERFERVLRTNIFGTYYGSLVAINAFLAQKEPGKLINLLGRGDRQPVPLQNAYAPSKAWVRSFTLALAKEYSGTGIGVFAFNPGLVDTNLLRSVVSIKGYEDGLKPLRTIIRMWGNPPAVPAERALWLASPATDGKTGLTINVLSGSRLLGGAIRELGRKLSRRSQAEVDLHITSLPPYHPFDAS